MSENAKGYDDLYNDVISQGLCCTCGTCVGVCPRGSLGMDFGMEPFFDGEPQPILIKQNCNNCSLCYQACPGKDIPLPEIDQLFFGRKRKPEEEFLGIYRNIFEGYARNASIRDKGPSGGATTALLMYALSKGIIDGAIVANNHPEYPWRMTPRIATTPEDLLGAMSSKHILVPSNAVLNQAIMKQGLKKLAVVGCPCHIEAIRKIQLTGRPRKIAGAITLCISLYCGRNYWWAGTRHLLAEECGIVDLTEIAGFSYRGGERPKRFTVRLRNGARKEVPLFSSVLNYILPNMSERCSLCCDFSGEVADISLGDHYLAFFLRPDKPGWNSIITRTPVGEEILSGAENEGHLFLRSGPEKYVITNFGCECKKHGSAHHIDWRKKHHWPVPDFGYAPGTVAPWEKPYRIANISIDESYFGDD